MQYLELDNPQLLNSDFFEADAKWVAKKLLGKVIQVRHNNIWLMARIIETEAYYLDDKASHAWLGFTEKRKALFMSAGTIYMYYARGGDSLNFSCEGEGNAVLIKSAYPLAASKGKLEGINVMLKNNPAARGGRRELKTLCAGQTLLCKALGLRVPEWDAKQLDPLRFRIADDSYTPPKIIQTSRLGISPDRDGQLPYRFIDMRFAKFCTKNPLSVRNWQNGVDYTILQP